MRVLESYTFTPGPRGVGTIAIPEVLKLQDIAHIWNSTRGALIFDLKNPQYGILSAVVAGGVTTLTIENNTSTMDAADTLQILIYDPFPNSSGTSFSGTNGANDAFGRLRVSEPYTIADYKATYGPNSEFLTDLSGAGSNVTYVSDQAATRLTVGTDASDYVARQSRMYHQYQPGKSQLILFSFVLNGREAGADKRVGLFDDRNGVFLKYGGDGSLSWVERRYVTGSAVDFSIARNNWNVDKCDGTGPSGFDLNISATQLLFVDFQWLGVGRVRVGFVHDGNYVVAHEFYHSNTLTTVYWSQPSLPVRAEIRNTAVLDAPTTLDIICSSVQSEGGYSESGNDLAISSPIRTIGNAGATLPVLAIRLSNSFGGFPNRLTVRLSQTEGFSPVGGVRLDILRLASHSQLTSTDVGGIIWVPVNGISGVEYAVNATTLTTAATDQNLDSFFVSAGRGAIGPSSAGLINPASARLSFIAQNIASNDSMAFLIRAESLGTGATCACAIQWRELQ
jgi:hypothetical protein